MYMVNSCEFILHVLLLIVYVLSDGLETWKVLAWLNEKQGEYIVKLKVLCDGHVLDDAV